MATLFDYLTIVCFAGLVIIYFQFTKRGVRTLMQLMISGVAFAIANQMGNANEILVQQMVVGPCTE